MKHWLVLFWFTNAALNSGTQNEKLAALCQVWGFLKYAHPTVAEGSIDWDKALIDAIPDVLASSDKTSFDHALRRLLGKADWTFAIEDSAPSHSRADPHFGAPVVFWQESDLFALDIRKLLDRGMRAKRTEPSYYAATTIATGGIRFKNERMHTADPLPNEAMRLLALFRFWNSVQYLFPYKALIDKDWPATLKDYLPKFRQSADALAYHLLFLELTARLNDGHAAADSEILRDHFGDKSLPFTLKQIAGQTVIDKITPGETRFKRGDILLEIDGRKIQALRKKFYKYASGSNDSAIERSVNIYLSLGHSHRVRLKIRRADQTLTWETERITTRQWAETFLNRNATISSRMLADRIGYIDMGTLRKADVARTMRSFADAKGIVFDLRAPPKGTLYDVCAHLLPEKKDFVLFTEPDFRRPGAFIPRSIKQVGPPLDYAEYFKGEVAILVDERTMSHGELTAMALQTAPQATVIGSQTAGANGNVHRMPLPGGIVARFSGLGVYYPDGRGTQRVGIPVDIEVKPTIAGMQKGDDEVIRRAVLWIRNGK